ncbi:acetyl-CoA carboxylase biotin carboxyl carrier protein [Streptococcus sp. DD12]|uniref:acetyl-CoA carboxylase biotin carboxyl carrier protein n=1 Tax=Streptococcus sp. DD12 TaxID=1777880 RepID=UPI00079284DC|nr:acetyl-CoA carboxylase biotin carboxyl carrier protein [Streptococcus sp. DD12]KXT75540.1 Biotin carboxyl carrier protein of acetyl-CoA carboxylase [Streptococcus sp. DD12]
MNITEIKDLMAQFDASSLREFSYQTGNDSLVFSKNNAASPAAAKSVQAEAPVASTPLAAAPVAEVKALASAVEEVVEASNNPVAPVAAEGEIVESPLVGVAYLAPSPDKPAFVSVGDKVTKGQTLLIIEAMKVMNEVPAPKDGVVTEILVANEDMVEFGKGLVRIK